MLCHRRISIKTNHCPKFDKTTRLCMGHLHPRFVSNKMHGHRMHNKKRKRATDECHRCGKIGHWAKDCDEYTANPHGGGKASYPLSYSYIRSRSYYNTKESNPILQTHRYESQLMKFIQSNQFNHTVHMLHVMMQQGIKLNNISLFASILQALKLCNTHEFHVLELIWYMKYNEIAIDSNRFCELLGICVAKNDMYSAKQIAILWFETMPHFPVLPVIHCLSSHNTSSKPKYYKFHKLGKQEKIWQAIIEELNALSTESPSHITQKYLTPQSPKQHMIELLAHVQMHLTAKNHDLAIKHVHELHSFITNHSDNELLSMLKEESITWTQWLLRQELMHGDVNKIAPNDTLRTLHELGFNDCKLSSVNHLLQDIQRPLTLTNMDKLHLADHIHELERRLPFIIQFLSYNMKIGMITKDVMNNTQFIEHLIALVMDTATLKTNTSNVSRKTIDALFELMNTHYVQRQFHKHLFNDLKQRIIAQFQRIKHDGGDKQITPRHKHGGGQVMRHSGYVSLRKLFEFVNGFSKRQLEECRAMQEMNDLLPLMKHCSIQLFHTKAKYFPKQLSSRDLTNAIVEAAFRFEAEPLGHLLYYLFYHRIPYGYGLGNEEHMTMVPLQIDWTDLHKIYATLLSLSAQAMNQLKDIDIMHLLHYTPLPVQDQKYIAHESDVITVTRKRQQRVLPLLTGICARSGSFGDVIKSIHYFENDSWITGNMRSFGAFYLNETLLHKFTKHCVELEKKSDAEYIQSVKEMTQNIYKEWMQYMAQILDAADYTKYLLCIENLSSQIRMRQIAPLGQYLLYILDEWNIAPTWNIYENLWFAFNVGDKYMPASFGSDEDEVFAPLLMELDDGGNVLDRKYHELQGKYMVKQHIDYLVKNKRYEEAILMMNKYGEGMTSDEYKLSCMRHYVIDCELRNNDYNYYPFALSHWFPIAEPMSAKYFVQRRIDPHNDHSVIVSYDWHRKNEDGFVDKENDIMFYIPHDMMQQSRYKSAIIRYCREELFHKTNETHNFTSNCQVEIMPYSTGIDDNKLRNNAMKRGYDLFVVRGCQSLEEKLAIWSNMILFFEKDLGILSTVSCDSITPITNKLKKFMQSLCNKYQCVIDSNCISSFAFDAIPTFFIWNKSDSNSHLLHAASQAFKDYLASTSSTTHALRHHESSTLCVDISWKYHAAMNKMFYSEFKQISKDLRYVRDASRHADIDVAISAKDRTDPSKGGVISITAPTRRLRRRVYQQILYTHPPSNDTNLRIYDASKEREAFEWKDMDEMLFKLISSMKDEETLTISNAIYCCRTHEFTNKTKTREWMTNLFTTQNEECSLMKTPDEMVQLCQLLFSALSMRKDSDSNDGMIAQMFYNILTNHAILDMASQESIAQVMYCTILSLCNESMHCRSLSISDFHRVRAAFLHCYCSHFKTDGEGLNANLSQCLQQITQYESYLLIWLEYLYVSCLMKNPNLSGHITRFLNELLTLMVHETKLDTATYSQFCSSALDLLLIDIQSPQQECAQSFITMYQNIDKMDPQHVIYCEMDVESLKIILSQLNPLEIEHINVPYKTIQALYENICTGCSLAGNVDCIKLLLNRIEFLSKSYESEFTFGIDDAFLNTMCQNVFNYYHYTIGYDTEITAHYMMQLLESIVAGGDGVLAETISIETITKYAIWMAEHNLIEQVHSLKLLLIQNQCRFDNLIKVIDDAFGDLDYQQLSALTTRTHKLSSTYIIDQ
eukprot:928599_1